MISKKGAKQTRQRYENSCIEPITSLREKFGIGGEGVIVGFCKSISKMSLLQKRETLATSQKRPTSDMLTKSFRRQVCQGKTFMVGDVLNETGTTRTQTAINISASLRSLSSMKTAEWTLVSLF